MNVLRILTAKQLHIFLIVCKGAKRSIMGIYYFAQNAEGFAIVFLNCGHYFAIREPSIYKYGGMKTQRNELLQRDRSRDLLNGNLLQSFFSISAIPLVLIICLSFYRVCSNSQIDRQLCLIMGSISSLLSELRRS